MNVVVSVPGKIHLMGEHAVVYGKPALLAAINKRLVVTIAQGAKGLEIHAPEGEEYIQHAVEVVQKELGQKGTVNFKITVESAIPIGFHLGSSAAVAVGVVGACLYFFTKKWNVQKINALAYEVEKLMHKTPSGGDNTAVTYGGFVWYRKEFEFLKNMSRLPFEPHSTLNKFILVNTGRPQESTGEMVAMVRGRVEKDPRRMQNIFDDNEKQTKGLVIALKDGNEAELIDSIKHGEQTLEGMGVVSDMVKPLIRKIEGLGSSAKILGGGGKSHGVGFLLVYVKDIDKVKSICNAYNYSVEAITLGAEGVRVESKNI